MKCKMGEVPAVVHGTQHHPSPALPFFSSPCLAPSFLPCPLSHPQPPTPHALLYLAGGGRGVGMQLPLGLMLPGEGLRS